MNIQYFLSLFNISRPLNISRLVPSCFKSASPDLQLASPLFNRLPAEIRNQIYRLVLQAYDDKSRPFPTDAFYYRPGFRYVLKIDTALLRTCRRVYAEAHGLLKCLNNEHVEWHGVARGPRTWTAKKASHSSMTCVQLFMQQVNLEYGHTSIAVRLARDFPCLQKLKITIRHSDWWNWEVWAPLAMDPGCKGQPSSTSFSPAAAPFEENTWGRMFTHFPALERLVLELETREGKKEELDHIVARAADWRFPLESEEAFLVLGPQLTRKNGWIGRKLRKSLNLILSPTFSYPFANPIFHLSALPRLSFCRVPRRRL